MSVYGHALPGIHDFFDTPKWDLPPAQRFGRQKTLNEFNNLGVLTRDRRFIEWLPRRPVGPMLFRRAKTGETENSDVQTAACASLPNFKRKLDHSDFPSIEA